MKKQTSLVLTALLLSALPCSALVESWTSKDGRTGSFELIRTLEKDGEVAGEFRTANGKLVILKASDLDQAGAEKLAAAKAAAPPSLAMSGNDKSAAATQTGPPSKFDEILDGNLERLRGKSLRKCDDATKPTQYYLFYYTASWCGPCHKFTPSLVTFYNKIKDKSDGKFELVLITSDSDEKAMEGYAAEMKMPWPQLKLSKAEKFKKDYLSGGNGIPSLVLTDLEGKVIQGSYENGTYVGPQVAMQKLEALLKAK